MQLKDKKVLITGGSRGIGKCMIDELVKQGVQDIAVIGRDKENLKALRTTFESVNFILVRGDVGDLNVLRDVTSKIEDEWGSLDILINNAGIVSAGPLEDLSDEDIYDQVSVNLTAVMVLTKYCIPLLRHSQEGAILNVSSGLGLIGMPFYSVYASTKAAIRQFSDAIRRELEPDSISVTCVYPTATDTDMMTTSKATDMDSPEFVAERSIQAMVQKKLHVIFGGEERLNDSKLNFESPEKFDAKIAKSYEERKEASLYHKAM
ncbi:MAG: short-chain dehydrogenase [Pseudozobellia sp.]|nr:short-chain dehydrogenase [Pseudozobellia sp.]MBG47796.1 short-chain dehydrogenase [Pseudozobellia sp.]|tara:strand:+ start:373 stop:1161 length:789 start_codon:yes stop_codon:yes gene_type:complete